MVKALRGGKVRRRAVVTRFWQGTLLLSALLLALGILGESLVNHHLNVILSLLEVLSAKALVMVDT